MYFPIGWPKVVQVPDSGQSSLKQIKCNRDRILVAILTDDVLAIWFCKVCLSINGILVSIKLFSILAALCTYSFSPKN